MGDLIVEDPIVEDPIVDEPIAEEEEFVWPWMGIVANIKTKQRGRKFVGESGSKLRTEFSKKGFIPVRVHPLWDFHGHSGFAVVEFEKNWRGFHSAMLFEQSFKNEGCGKEDFDGTRCPPGEKLYGWVARADDYNGGISVMSKYLQRNGDLKTVLGLEAEEKGKFLRLVSNLNETLEMKSSEMNEMESKCDETKARLEAVMRETDEKTNEFNAEREKEIEITQNFMKKVLSDHEKVSQQLEAEKKKLEEHEKQLQQRRAMNDSERRKIYHEQQMNQRATDLQKKAGENVLRLAEEQTREKEKLNKRVIELEKQLNAKQTLELEIERLRGAFQVTKHMDDQDEDLESKKKKMEEIQEQLREKEEEFVDVKELYNALVVKQQRQNDEVQDARNELIRGLEDSKGRASIAVKSMGES